MILNCGSSPASIGNCRSSDWQNEWMVCEHQLQDLADDRGGFSGPGAGFDDEIAALWGRRQDCRRHTGEIKKGLLLGHSGPSSNCSNVRGSRSCETAYFSSASCFVRQE